MAQSILELIFKTAKQGQGGKQAAAELKDLKGTVGELSSGLLGFNAAGLTAAGAVVALAGALKGGFEAGKEGAGLNFAIKKFDNLSASMGRASDVMLGDLRDATRGLVSDSDLVAQAGGIMSLGLVGTADAVVRLTKLAGGLGMDMNELTLTLANKTTMRFDQLGVKIAGFDERLAKLKESGMDADAAFTEAFLQQAEAQLELVGNKADDGSAAFDRLDTAGKNLSTTFKRALAPAAIGVAEGLTDVIDWTIAGGDANADYEKSHYAIVTAEKRHQEALKVVGKELLTLNSGMDVGAGSVRSLASGMDVGAERMIAAAESAGLFVENIKDVKWSIDELNQIMQGKFGEEQQKFNDQQRDLKNEIAGTKDKIGELEQKKYLTNEQKVELGELKTNLGELQTELANTATAHNDAMQRMAFDMLQQRAASDGLTENEIANLTKIAVQWGLWDEKTAAVVSGINENMGSLDTSNPSKILDILNGILGLPDKKSFTVDVSIHGANELYRLMNAAGGEPEPVNQPGGTSTVPVVDDYSSTTQRANAGLVTVPPGFPNDSYRLGLSSGESAYVVNDRMRWTGEGSQAPAGPSVSIGQVVIKNDMDYRTLVARLKADLKK